MLKGIFICVFVVSLTMLSVSQMVTEELTKHLPGGAEGKHKNFSKEPGCGLFFEPGDIPSTKQECWPLNSGVQLKRITQYCKYAICNAIESLPQ